MLLSYTDLSVDRTVLIFNVELTTASGCLTICVILHPEDGSGKFLRNIAELMDYRWGSSNRYQQYDTKCLLRPVFQQSLATHS
jgi:hypothetical protein